MKMDLRWILGCISLLMQPAIAANSPDAHFVLQAGGFSGHSGRSQNIAIQDLIGDYFSVTHFNNKNVLLGLGYFCKGIFDKRYDVQFGINAFYLAPTHVNGLVTQEQLFTNLSYKYANNNLPIYINAKSIIHTQDSRYNVVADVGLGPNIMHLYQFREKSLDGGVTLPDDIFHSNTHVALAATLGLGVQINNLFHSIPLELSYRFFYLGHGNLSRSNDQILNSLSTGNTYAQALILGVSI